MINIPRSANISIELKVANYHDRLKIRKGSIEAARDNGRSRRCQTESESRPEKDIPGVLTRGHLNNHRHGM